MYVDIHNHLIPNIDDGVKSEEEALTCLEIALKEKISTIFVTPHFKVGTIEPTPERIISEAKALANIAKKFSIKILPGSEVLFDHNLPNLWKEGKLLSMAGNKKHILIETSLTTLPRGIRKTIYDLRILGLEPILAHPERTNYFQSEVKRMIPLSDAGCLSQVTTYSITGFWGSDTAEAAMEMIERQMVHFIASDAHSPRSRKPMMREAIRILSNRFGIHLARTLAITNPMAIVLGSTIEQPPKVRRKRRFSFLK